MKKYLKKLESNPKYINTTNQIYSLIQQLTCGNGYKNGTKHMFYSENPTDHILIKDIFRRFKLPVVISNVKPNSFEFESPTEVIQIFHFRLCRYVRTDAIKKILEDTIVINKAGVTIQNAFLLAHYNNLSIPYYSDSMDIVYGFKMTHILNEPCKTLSVFKKKLTESNSVTYNNLYKINQDSKTKERVLLLKLIVNKDWKAANRYLLSLKFV